MNEDRIWRALGDATRRSLLDELAPGPRTTGDLVARTSVDIYLFEALTAHVMPQLLQCGHQDRTEEGQLLIIGHVPWQTR